MNHHSCVQDKPGICKWENYPGGKRKLTDRGRDVVKAYPTQMKCIECTFNFNSNTYFCNDYSMGRVRRCHDLYHQKYHRKEVDDDNIDTGQGLASV